MSPIFWDFSNIYWTLKKDNSAMEWNPQYFIFVQENSNRMCISHLMDHPFILNNWCGAAKVSNTYIHIYISWSNEQITVNQRSKNDRQELSVRQCFLDQHILSLEHSQIFLWASLFLMSILNWESKFSLQTCRKYFGLHIQFL